MRTTPGWRTLWAALFILPNAAGGQVELAPFWGAVTESEVERASAALLATRPDFDSLWTELSRGRDYSSAVPTGRLEFERKNGDGSVHRYFIVVPTSYQPTRRYPVRVYLHGGVSRPAPGAGGDWWRRWERLGDEDHVAVFPASWNGSLWWQASQVENLRGVLNDVKRTYNVDENRVSLFGVSDGGTGAYFMAYKDPTVWSSFVPLIGHAAVLLNPQVGADGEMHMVNLANSSFFIVNGETDRLYPVRSVQPWVDSFRAMGVDLEFAAKPTGHDVTWWGDEADNIDAFLQARPRPPHPQTLAWAVEPWAPYTRAWWLVVDELNPGGGGAPVAEGIRGSDMAGVVWARRDGNTISLETNQVQRVRLLLSPDVFDLTRPIKVTANGEAVFDGTVEPDPAVTLKWAAIDQDRTMLYAAELLVQVAPRPGLR